jgi:hypothetical protein
VVAHKFRGWLGQPEAGYFNEYLNDYRNEVLSKLVLSSDTVELHRLQGSLRVLGDIIELRGEMDSYIKGVSNGQMRKIEKPREVTDGMEK